MPPLPTDDSQPRSSLRLIGCVALVGMLAFLLSALFGAGPIAVLMVAVVVFGVPLFHYILWGWWLSSRIRDDAPVDGTDE